MGKGIALALAEQGATVYVTGRTRALNENDPQALSTDRTAQECRARGGLGIAVQVDHACDQQVEALFQRIRSEHGRLDLLVNNAIAIPEEIVQPGGFWQKPLSNWDMFDIGVRSAFVASREAAKIMVPQGSGLIVAISGYVGRTFTYNTVFGTTKAATDRMARDMAIELKPFNVASISLWQGFTYTELALRNLERVEGMASNLNSRAGSSVEFPGRVIASLLADPDIMALTGGTHISAELAERYGITDIDGRVIPSLRGERGAPIWQPV
jgi:NAD(P)-dependent dehydrogenase (short-subunit alcohol dehydrogenase family)